MRREAVPVGGIRFVMRTEAGEGREWVEILKRSS